VDDRGDEGRGIVIASEYISGGSLHTLLTGMGFGYGNVYGICRILQ
jgi:hypothetical protein